MSDSQQIDDAVIAKLSEPTLAGLMPDGVFVDIAAADAMRFVLVSVLDHDEVYMFEGVAFERCLYLVKAVERSSTISADLRAAETRIHELMRQPLTVPGYVHDHTDRIKRIANSEVDDIDNEIRWQHRGAHYEVLMVPSSTTVNEGAN
jgi:hypothetical protein